MGFGDYFKPLGNLLGINPLTSKSTAGYREYANIRQQNKDRGFRNGKYYDYLDVEKERKKTSKSSSKMLTPVFNALRIGVKSKPVKPINYKDNVYNKKGQKLTLIRPPLIDNHP